MWTASPEMGIALTRSHAMSARAAVTLGGDLLADIEPDSWEITTSLRDGQIESELSMVITDPTGDMLTEQPESPLQAYGQRVALTVTVESGDWSEAVPMGQWRISTSDPSGGPWRLYPSGRWVRPAERITTRANDLLDLLAEYDFLSLSTPPAGATTAAELARLVDGTLPIQMDVASQTVPSTPWEQSRIDAVLQLMRDADAVAWVDRAGTLRPLPAAGSGAGVTIQPADQTGYVAETAAGLVSWRPTASREGVYNGVGMTGQRADGATIYGQAIEASGPTAWSAARFGRVTYRAHSPLLTTQARVDAGAATRLRSLTRARSQTLEVQILPDPRIDPLDTVRIVVPDTGRVIEGLIVGTRIGSHGPMALEVSVPFGAAIY